MLSTKSVPPAFAPAMLWLNTSMTMLEMLVASSQVIGHRTHLMMNAGPIPSPDDCAEMTLMGSEKLVACADVAGRAARGWMSLNQQWSQALVDAMTTPQAIGTNVKQALALSSAAARFSSDLLHPVHGKATANARRLGALAGQRLAKPGR
jgi:hypothetical protein